MIKTEEDIDVKEERLRIENSDREDMTLCAMGLTKVSMERFCEIACRRISRTCILIFHSITKVRSILLSTESHLVVRKENVSDCWE